MQFLHVITHVTNNIKGPTQVDVIVIVVSRLFFLFFSTLLAQSKVTGLDSETSSLHLSDCLVWLVDSAGSPSCHQCRSVLCSRQRKGQSYSILEQAHYYQIILPSLPIDKLNCSSGRQQFYDDIFSSLF